MFERPEYFDVPFAPDGRGRTALTTRSGHVGDLIRALLFTRAGERVNRPDFGCGLRQLLFQPNSDLLGSATEALVASSLDRYLADWIEVRRVEIRPVESALHVTIEYIRRDTREPERLEASVS